MNPCWHRVSVFALHAIVTHEVGCAWTPTVITRFVCQIDDVGGQFRRRRTPEHRFSDAHFSSLNDLRDITDITEADFDVCRHCRLGFEFCRTTMFRAFVYSNEELNSGFVTGMDNDKWVLGEHV